MIIPDIIKVTLKTIPPGPAPNSDTIFLKILYPGNNKNAISSPIITRTTDISPNIPPGISRSLSINLVGSSTNY